MLSSNVSTAGESGRSELVLRVPTARIQEAIARKSFSGEEDGIPVIRYAISNALEMAH